MSIHQINHPLVRHKIGLMREADISTKKFRELTSEIARLLAYEASKDFELEPVTIEGWAGPVEIERIKGKKVTVVPILRAGLGMLDGVLDMMPSAKVSVVGIAEVRGRGRLRLRYGRPKAGDCRGERREPGFEAAVDRPAEPDAAREPQCRAWLRDREYDHGGGENRRSLAQPAQPVLRAVDDVERRFDAAHADDELRALFGRAELQPLLAQRELGEAGIHSFAPIASRSRASSARLAEKRRLPRRDSAAAFDAV